jgi:aspartate aminotransferase-like enzyme
MKSRLFTPGPTPVPEEILLRMAEPLIHHRHPKFHAVMERVDAGLQYVFQSTGPVLTLSSSGTGGMEAMFVNLFSPGETVISVNQGKFGERWVQMPRTFGLHVVEITVPWGRAVDPGQVGSVLGAHPEARAVILTHSETSTGTATDIEAIARIVRGMSDALICVDGITAIGAHEFRFDAWGIDACVSGSQKGLMIPPGLAFVALSSRALRAAEKSTLPRFYFDFGRALEAHARHDTPWTPAVSLLVGLDAALEMIRQEGIEKIWARHRRLALALRRGVEALSLRLFSEAPSFAVTPVWLPQSIAWEDFEKALRIENGITVAGGQGDFAGKIFRVAHLGYYDDLDMVVAMAGIERALARSGYNLQPGRGVEAVQKALLERAEG